MGILTEKVGQGLEALQAKFKDRLRGWAAGVIGFGFEVFADIMAKSASAKMLPILESIEAVGELPPEVKDLLGEMKSPTGESTGWALGSAMARVSGSVTNSFMETVLRGFRYRMNRLNPTEVIGVNTALASWLRGDMPDADIELILSINGFDAWQQEKLKKLLTVILPSDIALPAWLRDKPKYQWAVDNLPKLGLDEKTVELLTEMTYKLPSIQDVVSFLAHEVFEPDMIAKYGLDDEWGNLDKSMFEKVGMKEETALAYWRNHWQHANWSQVTQMLHRGKMTDKDVFDWYRLVEIPPYWRDKLTELSWDLPNRIELRMMARYGLIDKPFLMNALKEIGVREDYREVIADMNLAMGLRTDLQTRYANGYITAEQVKSELVSAGLSAIVAERLYQYIVKVAKPERTAAEKNLTKAEIVKGVKVGVITWEEGRDQLMALGYDEEEALYILAINIEVETGSPHNLGDFKRLTDLARAAQGLPTDRTPAEIAASEAAAAAKYPVKVKLSKEEYDTRVKTTRWRRTHGELTRDEEVTALLGVGVEISLAQAYADYDGTRPGAKRED